MCRTFRQHVYTQVAKQGHLPYVGSGDLSSFHINDTLNWMLSISACYMWEYFPVPVRACVSVYHLFGGVTSLSALFSLFKFSLMPESSSVNASSFLEISNKALRRFP